MTIEYALKYIITYCLIESVMDNDETAREAVDKRGCSCFSYICGGV
jgi:hypothetical protein